MNTQYRRHEEAVNLLRIYSGLGDVEVLLFRINNVWKIRMKDSVNILHIRYERAVYSLCTHFKYAMNEPLLTLNAWYRLRDECREEAVNKEVYKNRHKQNKTKTNFLQAMIISTESIFQQMLSLVSVWNEYLNNFNLFRVRDCCMILNDQNVICFCLKIKYA